jgi:hypothetical protein
MPFDTVHVQQEACPRCQPEQSTLQAIPRIEHEDCIISTPYRVESSERRVKGRTEDFVLDRANEAQTNAIVFNRTPRVEVSSAIHRYVVPALCQPGR